MRRLNDLISAGRVVAEGNARARLYRLAMAAPALTTEGIAAGALALSGGIPLAEDGRDVLAYVTQPLAGRRPVGYDRAFLDDYVPNETWYLGPSARSHLRRLGDTKERGRPAGTFGRAVLSRLLIDLSWASSYLEGNTYTRLDTRELIEHGRVAAGKDAIETQMILNHKAAIELLVDEVTTIDFDMYSLTSLHGILSENLLADPGACGRLRVRPVDITGSVFRPLAIPQQIEELFRLILDKAAKISDAFEQALFVMVHLPYLQPFEDVNKRVSRMAANIPLLQQNLCPLTFLGVPEAAYVQATLGVYELNRVELLRDLFIWSYERSTQEYLAVHKSLAEPDPIRLRYRQEIHEVVGRVVRTLAVPALPVIEYAAQERIGVEDRSLFIEVVLDELKRLHEGVLVRYKLKPADFHAWQAASRHPK